MAQEIAIPAQNRNPLKPVAIREVSATCNCVQAGGAGGVPRFGQGSLRIVIRPNKYEDRIWASVRAVDTAGAEHHVIITGTIQQPFAGWPTAACARVDDGIFTVPCSSRMLSHVGAAYLELPDAVAEGTVFVDEGVIVFEKAGPSELDGSATLWLVGESLGAAWEWRGQVLGEICEKSTPSRTDAKSRVVGERESIRKGDAQ